MTARPGLVRWVDTPAEHIPSTTKTIPDLNISKIHAFLVSTSLNSQEEKINIIWAFISMKAIDDAKAARHLYAKSAAKCWHPLIRKLFWIRLWKNVSGAAYQPICKILLYKFRVKTASICNFFLSKFIQGTFVVQWLSITSPTIASCLAKIPFQLLNRIWAFWQDLATITTKSSVSVMVYNHLIL